MRDHERQTWGETGHVDAGGQVYPPEPQSFFTNFFESYARFSGRASRAEYWQLTIGLGIIELIIVVFARLTESAALVVMASLFSLFFVLPLLSVSIRRLHDIGKSGLWWFIQLVPIIGGIVFFIFMILPSQSGENEYGPNPYGE